MGRLMDILLALAKALCGGSATEEQLPSEYEKPHAERPPHQEAITTRPRPQVAPEYYRQEQEPKPKPKPKPHDHIIHQHQNLINQHDKPKPKPHVDHIIHQHQHQTNQHDEHYVALRAKANEEGDLMARSFQKSHEAYAQGDGALAKALSVQGKQHERTMERLNAEASAWIFRQNNLDRGPGEIDLHGLYVKEAISYVEKSVQEARQRGDAVIRLIVGKGLHSDNHVAKIKPAIEDLMKKYNIRTEVDPHNAGVVIALLS